MKNILILLCVAASLQAKAQHITNDTIINSIVAEGKLLYQSEMASWHGTDLFLKQYKDQNRIGGYLSYTNAADIVCIFVSKDAEPIVLGAVTFDSSFNLNNASINLKERPLSSTENDLYLIRKKALALVNSDTLFEMYPKTNLNLVPIIFNQQKKVYVITGATEQGVIFLGNDYLINFDEAGNISSRNKIHMSLIPFHYQDAGNSNQVVIGGMHSHVPETGDYITPTDICTLMLYSKYAKWKQHTVVTQRYVNTWNCETNGLSVTPMDASEDPDRPGKKRKKRRNQD